MYKVVHRGEIWLVDWNPGRGSEQTGQRLALIIQNEMGTANPYYRNVIVLSISTKSAPLPFHIRISPDKANGLSEISFVKCEQVMTITKDRLKTKLGTLSTDYLDKIWEALARILQ